ncbi:MAG: hypothetical protein CMF59_17315 [Leptospiraceae bacterium]|nr:hypothetical protein [Leptospiraceae bacterium]
MTTFIGTSFVAQVFVPVARDTTASRHYSTILLSDGDDLNSMEGNYNSATASLLDPIIAPGTLTNQKIGENHG